MNPKQIKDRIEKEKGDIDKKFIGLTHDEAKKLWNGEVRMVEKDGAHYVVTRDYNLTRLNLHIKNGLIYRVDIG